MASDRGAILAVRAAVRGIVDFSKARFLDPTWWSYLALIYDELEEEAILEVHKAVYQYQLAILSSGALSDASAKKFQTDARDTFTRISDGLQPWLRDLLEKQRKTEAEDLLELYRREFGDMKDPKFREQMLAEAQRLNEMDANTPKQTKSPLVLGYERVQRERKLKEQQRRNSKRGR